MIRWGIVGLVLLVGFAGCSALPFVEPPPQEEPAPVKLVNNASVTETFIVGVIDEEASLRVEFEDGRVANYTAGPGSSTITTSNESNFTSVQFPNSVRNYSQHTLAPGQSKLLSIEGVAPNEAIVVVVYDRPEGTYRSIKTLSCGNAILGYRITSQKGGPDDWTMSTHSCG